MTLKEFATATRLPRTTLQSCLERLREVGRVEGGGRGQRWTTPATTTTLLTTTTTAAKDPKPRNSATMHTHVVVALAEPVEAAGASA
jgi:hypothetical protein